MPPALVIRLALEAAPRVYVEALHEGEHARLVDWIAARPALGELVARALELEDERRAA